MSLERFDYNNSICVIVFCHLSHYFTISENLCKIKLIKLNLNIESHKSFGRSGHTATTSSAKISNNLLAISSNLNQL